MSLLGRVTRTTLAHNAPRMRPPEMGNAIQLARDGTDVALCLRKRNQWLYATLAWALAALRHMGHRPWSVSSSTRKGRRLTIYDMFAAAQTLADHNAIAKPHKPRGNHITRRQRDRHHGRLTQILSNTTCWSGPRANRNLHGQARVSIVLGCSAPPRSAARAG